MGNLSVSDLVSYLRMKYVDQNEQSDGYTKECMSQNLFMKLVEEIGEVAEALNKNVGRKADDGQSDLAKELVDVLHYTIALAAVNAIDLPQAIVDKDAEASIKYNQQPCLNEFLRIK